MHAVRTYICRDSYPGTPRTIDGRKSQIGSGRDVESPRSDQPGVSGFVHGEYRTVDSLVSRRSGKKYSRLMVTFITLSFGFLTRIYTKLIMVCQRCSVAWCTIEVVVATRVCLNASGARRNMTLDVYY